MKVFIHKLEENVFQSVIKLVKLKRVRAPTHPHSPLSSIIIEGIKAVLFFFTKRFHTHKKHKKPKKHKT